MSYHSHRRPTPVPTDSIFVFGREIDQLPSISESPPDKPGRTLTQSMESISSSEETFSGPPTTPMTRSSLSRPYSTNSAPPTSPSAGMNKGNVSSVEITEIKEEEEDSPLVTGPTFNANGNGNEPKTEYVNVQLPSNGRNEIGLEKSEKEKACRNSYLPEIFPGRDESVKEALLSLFFIVFHLIFSIVVGLWHRGDGNTSAGHLTLAIIVLSGVLIELAYFFNGNIKKGHIWKSSKLLGILFLIPWTLPILMSISNVAFAAKEAKDPKYVRPWANYQMIFLVESLTLVFPQCILQLSLLMEDYHNFPSIKGCIIAVGLFILSGGMTFARVRFDSAKKIGRFGEGTEKYIRYSVIWASKVLWLLTYCCLIVSVRIMYGVDHYMSILVTFLILLVLHEVPILISTIQACNRFTSSCISLFFLLPQFIALFALLLWVNVDKSVYAFNIGSCILGMFFWVESLCIMGWLLDRCTGREADFFSEYPHFFGNMFKQCFK